MKELMAHPISKEGASAKAATLGTEAAPVMKAVFEAQIDIVNLLTSDQRTLFNEALVRCARSGTP